MRVTAHTAGCHHLRYCKEALRTAQVDMPGEAGVEADLGAGERRGRGAPGRASVVQKETVSQGLSGYEEE